MTDPALKIRRMKASDVDRVTGLAAAINGAPQWPRAAYITAIAGEATPSRVALVAEELPSETLLGFVVAMVLAPEAELETIAVASSGQRRRIGRRLFAALTAELSASGVTDVHLEVRCSNHQALAFYAALGFVETGRRPRYYTGPIEDAVLLRFQLPDMQAR